MFHQGRAVLFPGGGFLAEHALAGAGGVHQHPVETAGPGCGQTGGILIGDEGVGHPHALQVLAQHLGAGSHELIGQQQPLPLQRRRQLAGLAARGRAKVSHPLAWAHVQKGRRG